MTLPVIIVRERAAQGDQDQLRDWLQNWEPVHLAGLVAMMEKYDAFTEARTVIQHYLTAARQALGALPVSEGRGKLAGLTHFLAEQTAALGVAY
jgi:geranylgeranyl pyrophosphate synthase